MSNNYSNYTAVDFTGTTTTTIGGTLSTHMYTTYSTPQYYIPPPVPQKGLYKDGNAVWLNGQLLWRLM